MKIFKTVSAIVAYFVLFVSMFGDPVCILLTLKRADSLCKTDYSGMLHIGEYRYDKKKDIYSFELIDKSGIVSELSYDPLENTFTDRYYIDYCSYAINVMRGECISKLRAAGADPDEITLYVRIDRGIIGEKVIASAYKIVLLYDAATFEEFADTAYNAIKAVRNDGLKELEIYSHEFSLNVNGLAFFADKHGIISRIAH